MICTCLPMFCGMQMESWLVYCKDIVLNVSQEKVGIFAHLYISCNVVYFECVKRYAKL